MKHISKKATIGLLVALLALTMAAPALSFARPATSSSMTGLMDVVSEANAVAAAKDSIEAGAASTSSTSSAASASSESSAAATSSAHGEMSAEITTDGASEPKPAEASAEVNSAELRVTDTRDAGDCTATIRYLENPWDDDSDKATEEDGRVLLGTYTVTGLHEGDVLNAWDYAVDIPGHFFFDGWPLNLVVSSDPAQNVITLTYVKLWNCEYTVNYYLMEGADLTADNWSDALKPEGVTFTKIASETFDDQVYDTLVKGDAYEYQMDGTYVIDTYPAEIRVGLDPDDNVINVLYTTTYATLPDDAEVVEGAIPGDSETPDETPLPDDSTFDKDDIIDILPDGSAPGSDVYDDFVGTTVRPGELVVTDEMLQHPLNKEQATVTAMAYETGLHQASNLARTGDQLPLLIGVLVMGAAIVVLAVGVVVLSRRGKSGR